MFVQPALASQHLIIYTISSAVTRMLSLSRHRRKEVQWRVAVRRAGRKKITFSFFPSNFRVGIKRKDKSQYNRDENSVQITSLNYCNVYNLQV